MRFDKNKISYILSQLGIDHDRNKVVNNWMSVRCPLHNDKNLGNASINLSSGVISCFSCNQSISIIKLYMQRKNLNYSEAMKELFGSDLPIFLNPNTVQSTQSKPKKVIEQTLSGEYLTIELDPEKFRYTKQRGFTKEYCKEFNIVHCISDYYVDYYLTPIVDKKKNINTFEARKLCLYEKIYSYFNTSEKDPLEYFKEEKEKYEWVLRKGVVIDKHGEINNNITLAYLLKQKVLYPSNSGINNTIFNRENLDYNEDLWLSEGLGTHPKLYNHISKNSSAIFGTKVTDEQLLILKNFKKKIIIILDNDSASFEMVKYLHRYLDNLYICLSDKEDTDNDFIKSIKEAKILKASQYILMGVVKNVLKEREK